MLEESPPVNLHLTPKAAKGLRSRVYRDVIGLLLLFLTFARGFLGHEIDTHIAGLHLPAGIVFPAGTAIIAALVAYLGGLVGNDRNSTLFDGLLDTIRGKTPADAIETTATPTTTTPPSPTFSTGPAIVPGSHAEDVSALATEMLAKYANTDGVEVTSRPADPIGPHGVNAPGTTDPAPIPLDDSIIEVG